MNRGGSTSFDIDCQAGRAALSLDHSENQFPNRADQGEEFFLPHSGTVRIVPPFGLETYVLLSTAEHSRTHPR